MLTTILVVILVLILIGSFPIYPYNQGWGIYPSSVIGVVLVVLLILALLGRI